MHSDVFVVGPVLELFCSEPSETKADPAYEKEHHQCAAQALADERREGRTTPECRGFAAERFDPVVTADENLRWADGPGSRAVGQVHTQIGPPASAVAIKVAPCAAQSLSRACRELQFGCGRDMEFRASVPEELDLNLDGGTGQQPPSGVS